MLSSSWKCPHCGDRKPEIEDILEPSILANITMHFFCKECGNGYEVSYKEGLYDFEPIQVET